jgi:hypothetical protein
MIEIGLVATATTIEAVVRCKSASRSIATGWRYFADDIIFANWPFSAPRFAMIFGRQVMLMFWSNFSRDTQLASEFSRLRKNYPNYSAGAVQIWLTQNT